MRKRLVRKSLLALLIAACLVLAAAVLTYFSHIPIYYSAAVLTLPALYFARKATDPFLLFLITALLTICMREITYFTPIVFSMVMLLTPICVLMHRGDSLAKVLSDLGFHGHPIRTFLLAVLSMVPALFFMIILSYAAYFLGFNDAQKVDQKITELPFYVLLYAITVGPLAEEVFFRSFLSRYMNPVFANLLFAFAHFSYGSVYEIVGAFGLGIFLYLVYRYSGDLKTAVFAHMLINAGSLYMMRFA